MGLLARTIRNGGGANGDGTLCSGRAKGAGIAVKGRLGQLRFFSSTSPPSSPVVVAGGDGKVQTGVDRSVDGLVEGDALAAAQAHVGDGAAVRLVVVGARLFSRLLGVRSGPVDAPNDVGHGARAVGAEHLDGDNVGLLGDAVLARADGAGAVGAVAVGVDVLVVLRNGLAPLQPIDRKRQYERAEGQEPWFLTLARPSNSTWLMLTPLLGGEKTL